ncbi:ADP-ribosyltransferase, partial [Bacillus sp. 196mf]|uniref:ADP-ribosyltransferase n=1 Tax=Bacillus sp. 196mf TaxID=1761754 RepID=UPI000D9FF7D6
EERKNKAEEERKRDETPEYKKIRELKELRKESEERKNILEAANDDANSGQINDLTKEIADMDKQLKELNELNEIIKGAERQKKDVLDFRSDENGVKKWADETLVREYKPLLKQQQNLKDLFYFYTREGRAINEEISGRNFDAFLGDFAPGQLQEKAEEIKAVFDKPEARLPQGMNIYRRINKDGFPFADLNSDMIDRDFTNGHKVNRDKFQRLQEEFNDKDVTELGFMSFSGSKDPSGIADHYGFLQRPAILKLEVPKGYPVIYVPGLFPENPYVEFLINAGTTYHIDEISIKHDGPSEEGDPHEYIEIAAHVVN